MNDEQLSPRRRWLAAELRRLRLHAGMSGPQLAAELGWSPSKVSRLETARRGASRADVQSWLDRLNPPENRRREVLDLVDAIETETTTARLLGDGFARRQGHYAALEASATTICTYNPAIIPGLFQTAGYIRRVLTLAGLVDPAEIGAGVTARLDRQSILYDETKTIEAVITEPALRWRPGPPSVSLDQLDRLASLATLPNVRIGLIPLDLEGVDAPMNQFVIFKMGDSLDTVIVETYTAEVSIIDRDGLAEYDDIFRRHQDSAVYGQQARDLLDRLSADLRRQPPP